MSPKPSLIFVHGAWHSRDCWSSVISKLQGNGYRCFAPQLEFCGTEKPVESIASSIGQIQTLISAETTAGRDVVLVNHSFGGTVGCSAIKGFTKNNSSGLSSNSGKVTGIIQVCAFFPMLNAAPQRSMPPRELFHHPAPNGWSVIDNDDPASLFYNDLSPEDAQLWKSRLKNQSTAALRDSVHTYAGWADVPVWFLHCTQDRAIPMQTQKVLVEAARMEGATVATRSLDAGHSPFLSKVDETVNFVLEVLSCPDASATL